MGVDAHCPELDTYDLVLIRRKARTLAEQSSSSRDDQDDIEQDLVLHALQRLARFDRARGSLATFIDRVLTHKLADLMEAARTQSRGNDVPVLSLDATVETDDAEEIPIDETAVRDAIRAQRGLSSSKGVEHILARLALAQALDSLAPAQRQLWHLVAEHGVTAAARELGVGLTTVKRRLRKLRGVVVPKLPRASEIGGAQSAARSRECK